MGQQQWLAVQGKECHMLAWLEPRALQRIGKPAAPGAELRPGRLPPTVDHRDPCRVHDARAPQERNGRELLAERVCCGHFVEKSPGQILQVGSPTPWIVTSGATGFPEYPRPR